jgi:Dienelactone hydrolase family
MGYCFGGAAALELARSGEAKDIKGYVTFHGGLKTPQGESELVWLGWLPLEKTYQGAFDPVQPASQASAKQRGFELPALISFDHAGMNVARTRDRSRVGQDLTRFVSSIDDRLLPKFLAFGWALQFSPHHRARRTLARSNANRPNVTVLFLVISRCCGFASRTRSSIKPRFCQ